MDAQNIQLQTSTADAAHYAYAASRYLHQTQQTCYDKCVVDFQTSDIGAFEKECANACINKHMAIFKDILRSNWLEIVYLSNILLFP